MFGQLTFLSPTRLIADTVFRPKQSNGGHQYNQRVKQRSDSFTI